MAVAELKPDGNADSAVLQTEEKSLMRESFDRFLRNRMAVVSTIFIILVTSFAFLVAFVDIVQDPIQQVLEDNNALPEWLVTGPFGRLIMPENIERYAKVSDKYLWGADDLGRDLWSRAWHGARISLTVAIVASTVSLIIGTVYGSVSGYFGGTVDSVMMRIIDFIYGFPFLIVVILLQAFFKAQARAAGSEGIWGAMTAINGKMGGLFFMFIAIGLVGWIGMARIARGQVLSYKKKEFVEAARALGASDSRIMFRHLLPNILGPLIVAETLAIPGYISLEAFLSFIGLGVDPPTPSWGIMISEAVQSFRTYPNQILLPAIMLSLTTLAFNFMGDGVRDAFDPRMKR